MIFLPAFCVLALGASSVSYLGNECYYDGQCQSSRTCYGGRCLTREEAEEMQKEKRNYTRVSGKALFIVAVINAGLSIAAESGGFFPWIGPIVYPVALLWIALIQVSAHMAINQLRQLDIAPGRKLNRIIAAGWGLLGVAAAVWIACLVLHIRGLGSMGLSDNPIERENSKNYATAYMIILYGAAVPLAITALAVAISARVVAARKVKSTLTTAHENNGLKSKLSLTPYVLPSATGFAAGFGGTF